MCSFLTLFSAGWLCLFHHSPIGHESHLDKLLKTWLHTFGPEDAASVSLWVMRCLGGFLILCGFLSFKCGSRKLNRYHYPVLIAAIILALTAGLTLSDNRYSIIHIIPYLLPISTPFVLLTYQSWQNKLDHWNYILSLIICTTLLGNALQFLLNHDSLNPSPSLALSRIGITALLQALIIKVVSFAAIAAAIGLFMAAFRRLSLYIIIALGAFTLLSHLIANLTSARPYFGLGYWLADILFFTSYWLLPTLILLSLASRRKTQTLRL